MSERFAAGARRLAGLATRQFGWTPDQFWHCTPAELAAILTIENPASEDPLSRSELAALMERENNG
ncbi:phage tail assembly chaperone [Alteraurantiacibacter aquimixticola]|uniref:Phage tail assembly chaperone n=1 Tax=Alteraurantiacibacter aquimixticola TaxID=2489173 RepID=A0A4T3EXM8_9SPHN|nr:phage tail assembly chaperone [Alteraurantiacibacter aquimixticola]TIX49379.1 phage tail assembly chaperone [Alteraurantiacibacter aquimixticola]